MHAIKTKGKCFPLESVKRCVMVVGTLTGRMGSIYRQILSPSQLIFTFTFRVKRMTLFPFMHFCSRSAETACKTEEDPDGTAAAQGGV